MRKSLSLLAVLALLSISSAALAQRLPNGTLYYSQDNNGNGLFVLNTNTGQAALVGAGNTAVTSNTVGLAESGVAGQLFGSTFQQLAAIQTDGSNATVLGGGGLAEGLAYDPVNNVLYRVINNNFATVNQANGAILTGLTAPGADVEGLAWTPRFGGSIYGIADSGNISFYNITLGTWNPVGNVGFVTDSAGLAYDPIGDILYMVSDANDNLYRVDPDTASATLVGARNLPGGRFGGGLAFIPFSNGSAAPEPGALALLLPSVALLALARRRR